MEKQQYKIRVVIPTGGHRQRDIVKIFFKIKMYGDDKNPLYHMQKHLPIY